VLHKPLDAYSLIDTVKSLIGEARPQRVEASSDTESAASLRALDRATPEAELAGAPEPGESFDTKNVDNIDPFGSAVEEALSDQEIEGQRRELVRQAVQEVLAASIPPLVDTITERVIERLKQT
jgi:hypothetical protein